MKASEIKTIFVYEVRRRLGRAIRKRLGRKVVTPLPTRVPIWKQKRLVIEHGLAVADGEPHWFYSALDRGDADPLTNHSLSFLVDHQPRDSRILITGCGTGITAFYLADHGFTDVVGIDLLPECIAVANDIKRIGDYTSTTFHVSDGFRPALTESYDVITALHWVFSAWMGNYGNEAVNDAFDHVERERLLAELLGQYAPYINPGGRFLIELTDAVTDYRLPEDHFLGAASSKIYPVRQTPEQVERVARSLDLAVEQKQLCVAYGHHPRTLYILRKREP